jgi:hypothetical protein
LICENAFNDIKANITSKTFFIWQKFVKTKVVKVLLTRLY